MSDKKTEIEPVHGRKPLSGHKRRQKFKRNVLDSKLSNTNCANKPVEEVLAVTSLVVG